VRVEEVLIAAPAVDKAGTVTHVRSTLILSSVQSLRAHSLYEHYIGLLDPGMRETVESMIAGAWLPVETALKHYRACDALGLTLANEIALGHEVGSRIQASLLGLLVKGAKSTGATPWTGLGYMDRLWERVFSRGWRSRRRPARAEGRPRATPRLAAFLRSVLPSRVPGNVAGRRGALLREGLLARAGARASRGVVLLPRLLGLSAGHVAPDASRSHTTGSSLASS
jgi:hypothetical protein